LQGTLRYIEETNQDNLCQIIIIIDGSPNGNMTAQEILKFVNDNSSLSKIHIIAIGKEQDVDLDLYKTITRLRFGIFQFVEFPRNVHLLKHSFDNIISTSYTNYIGTLLCGNLSAEIILSPNPTGVLYQTMQQEVGSTFPSVLSIVKFIPNVKIASPPTLSRHIMLPSSPQNHLPMILNESLKSEHMSAVVMLSSNWFALISSVTEKDKTTVVMSILSPHSFIPWGYIHPENPILCHSGSLPVFSKNNSKSYTDRERIYDVAYMTKPISFQTLIKYLKTLPQSKSTLQNEIKRLHNIAKLHWIPDIVTTIADILQHEISILTPSSTSIDPEIIPIIQQLLNDVRHSNLNSTEVNSTEQVSKAPTQRAMSVTNLLN